MVGIRIDGALVNYGNERQQVPLSPTIGGRISVDLTTSNDIFFLGAGPHLMLPNGRLRPYVYGTGGLAYFVTESSVEGNRGGEAFARTTNYEDLTLAYGGGVGVYIPVRQGSAPISIDFGARFQRTGRARYLREGSTRDNPDGSVSFTPTESQVELAMFHLGVSVGVDRSRGARR